MQVKDVVLPGDAEPRVFAEATKRCADLLGSCNDLQAAARLVQEDIRRRAEEADAAAMATLGEHRDKLAGLVSSDPLAAPWDGPWWTTWAPPDRTRSPSDVLGLGDLMHEMNFGSGHAALHARLLVPFIGHGSVWLNGPESAMDQLGDVLQGSLLRFLAAVAPGRVRLTLIDPVGLGQGFAQLMRLPEFVRGAAAWHERPQIRDALVELTGHMSMIIQKYLTDRYESIEAYNADAGEVAEPYRVLAISRFPAGFDARLAQRLLSIAKNGPRVGVYVIGTWNSTHPVPRDLPDQQLRSTGVVVKHDWPPSGESVVFDKLPSTGVSDRIVAAVDQGWQAASTVQVPVDRFLPAERWTETTVDGLSIPVGRIGADERVAVELGFDVHHALVGGATGSGKSVLLHTLIIGAAARYSPVELELFLVDFKVGVEFAPYASLPHARVVAIESEREFGLSVLRSLAGAMRRRGETLKAAGAANIAVYRRDTGRDLPRILLVVDEFQNLFEPKDTIAGEAKRLLDQLVREGRGFGIHVVLASQSLFGVEVEPSTISQLGLRIVLRMDEDNSRRFLAKDNEAARFLERPGEAYYNAAQGQVGGNRKFQVAFTTADDVRSTVDESVECAQGIGWQRRPVVFEGGKPADAMNNRALVELLGAPGKTGRPRGYAPLFLGEPCELSDDHAAFLLRRQSRSNALICGADEVAAMSVLAGIVLSYYGWTAGGDAQAYLVDLSNTDSPIHGQLGRLAKLSPQLNTVSRRQVAEMLATAHADLEQRTVLADRGSPPGAPRLLVIGGVQNARCLESEGFKATPTVKHLSDLLTHGPDLGWHTVLWAGSWSGLQRVAAVKLRAEFGTRVVLQGGDGLSCLPQQTRRPNPPKHGFALVLGPDDPQPKKIRCYGNTWSGLAPATEDHEEIDFASTW